MVRRRRAALGPEARESFRAVAGAVGRGKDALTSAVPGPRRPGTPLAQAVLTFEEALREAREHMLGWRTAETEPVWRSCADGLGESARLAERLRLEAPALDFEGMVMVLKDLIAPLEAFEEAERLTRDRRPRPARWTPTG
jgi:hypothetical protein